MIDNNEVLERIAKRFSNKEVKQFKESETGDSCIRILMAYISASYSGQTTKNWNKMLQEILDSHVEDENSIYIN